MTSCSLANWTFYLHWLWAFHSFGTADVLYLASAPSNLHILEGANGTLPCRSSVSSSVKCKWLHGNTQVHVGRNNIQWETSPKEGDCSIRILEADLATHGGTWQCTVVDIDGRDKQSDTVLLNVLVAPTQLDVNVSTTGEWQDQLHLRNGTLCVPTHTLLSLQCRACCANPPATVTWLRQLNGSEKSWNSTEDDIQKGTSSSTLSIQVARWHHGLILICRITHPTFPNSTPWTQEVIFDVLYAPENVTQQQEVIGPPLSPVALRCPLHSNPTPSYSWSVLSDEKEWQPLYGSHEATLQLNSSVPSGLYQCTATIAILTRQYVALTIFSLTRLELTTQPEATTQFGIVPTTSTTKKTTTQLPQRTIAISLNNNLTLTCPQKLLDQEANGTLKWYFRGVNSSSWQLMDDQGVNLTLTNITYSEIGMYRCAPENSSLSDQNVENVVHVILAKPVDAPPRISAQIVELIIILSTAGLLICLLLLIVIARLKMWSDERKVRQAADIASCSGSKAKYKKANSWPKVYRGHKTARVYAVIADVKDLHTRGDSMEVNSASCVPYQPKITEKIARTNAQHLANSARERKHTIKMNGTAHLSQTSKIKEKNHQTQISSENIQNAVLNGAPHMHQTTECTKKTALNCTPDFQETSETIKQIALDEELQKMPDNIEQSEINCTTDVNQTHQATEVDCLPDFEATHQTIEKTELNGAEQNSQTSEITQTTEQNSASEFPTANESTEITETNHKNEMSGMAELNGASAFHHLSEAAVKIEAKNASRLRKNSLSTESISGNGGLLATTSARKVTSGKRAAIGVAERPIWKV